MNTPIQLNLNEIDILFLLESFYSTNRTEQLATIINQLNPLQMMNIVDLCGENHTMKKVLHTHRDKITFDELVHWFDTNNLSMDVNSEIIIKLINKSNWSIDMLLIMYKKYGIYNNAAEKIIEDTLLSKLIHFYHDSKNVDEDEDEDDENDSNDEYKLNNLWFTIKHETI